MNGDIVNNQLYSTRFWSSAFILQYIDYPAGSGYHVEDNEINILWFVAAVVFIHFSLALQKR